MTTESQTPSDSRPSRPVVLVTGPAGSGKTTLGLGLAAAAGLAPLDLDSLTNPLLDVIGEGVLGHHWLEGRHAEQLRDGRYAALLAVAADAVTTGQGAVLIAPFTAELQGGAAWDRLRSAVSPAPVIVLHLAGTGELLDLRRKLRGHKRDDHRNAVAYSPPKVAHTRIDAVLSPAQQLFRALLAVGHQSAVDPGSGVFSRTYEGVLFDLDGTLTDSTAAVLRSWARLADEYGFDRSAVQENHGQPAHVLLNRMLAPDRVEAAAARVQEFETTDLEDVVATPGAVELLAALPSDRVAIVTSGKPPVAEARIRAAGLPRPGVVVTRDDVVRGKPDPEPFLLGAERLGVAPDQCLAVEDAAAGIRAAKRAGCTVLGVRGTASDEELAEADLLIDSLTQIRLASTGPIRLATAS